MPAGVPGWLSPLVSIIPGQLYARHLTSAKGLDTERPRSISKVTRTH
jgi:glucosamine--fructose-6-phosphate aminotransferase (isomerizing)